MPWPARKGNPGAGPDPMPDPAAPKRAMCTACLRPCKSCVCRYVAPVSSAVDLVVLQHPLEVPNAKGSARLLHLCVTGSTLATGEVFDAATLRDLLYRDGRTPVLLYPETPGQQLVAAPPVLGSDASGDPGAMRLVVLDGTWRKSRKMLYLNPPLHELPRLALTQVPASRYGIRKAHAPHQLSTLEAACYAMGQLEHDPQKFEPVLKAFDAFVARYGAMARQRAVLDCQRQPA